MAFPYLYKMQHHFDDSLWIRIIFMRCQDEDLTTKERASDREIGQDLSHFGHQARRKFMQMLHNQYQLGLTEEEVCKKITTSSYYQYLKSLHCHIRSIECHEEIRNSPQGSQEAVSFDYCIRLFIS